jgi:Zn finger protein HypA/HybF involved in hydrogenase expression
MTEDELTLDGNGAGGLLAEIFAAEATAMPRTCRTCGDRRALAEHRVYRSAGVVLRCPSCESVAARIAVADDRLIVEWRGVLEIPRAPSADA